MYMIALKSKEIRLIVLRPLARFVNYGRIWFIISTPSSGSSASGGFLSQIVSKLEHELQIVCAWRRGGDLDQGNRILS
jgi:hypothetical protein